MSRGHDRPAVTPAEARRHRSAFSSRGRPGADVNVLGPRPPRTPTSAFRGQAPLRGQAGGADRARTGDPLVANQVLSQLSYSPEAPVNVPTLAFRGQAAV